MTRNSAGNSIALIGVPSSAGARMAGQEQGPRALREAGLVQGLEQDGYEVLDLGDTEEFSFAPDTEHPKQQNLAAVVTVVDQVERRVDSALAGDHWPLVVGGDCTITIGVLAALNKRHENLGMIYLDGDVDLNTPETTLTGIFDGMVLAHVLGRGANELSHFGPRHPQLEEENIALFGYSPAAGGLDPVEMEYLETTAMARYPYEQLKDSVAEYAAQALRELASKVDHILIHFDIDVITVDDFPAVDVPHAPGLKIGQVTEALGVFLQSDKTVGLVVTEFNAARDPGGRCAGRLAGLIREARRPSKAI